MSQADSGASAMPNLQDDGSYEDAVAMMPDDLMSDDPPEPAKPSAKVEPKDAKEPKEPAKPDDKEPDAKDTATDDDEDESYIELPAEEEGKEATRVKLNEAVEAWRKVPALEADLAKARSTVPTLPAEIEQAIQDLGSERAKHIRAIEAFASHNQPVVPDLEMTNPASPKYDPERFHSNLQNYQRQMAIQNEAAAAVERLQDQQSQEEQALLNSRKAREVARLKTIWPEVFEKETGRQVRADLKTHYGLDDDTIDTVIDSRFFAMAKDALSARAALAKKAEVIKVVSSKPRLVVSTTRSKPSADSKRSEAMANLQKTGSLEDAVAALDGLF